MNPPADESVGGIIFDNGTMNLFPWSTPFMMLDDKGNLVPPACIWTRTSLPPRGPERLGRRTVGRLDLLFALERLGMMRWNGLWK